MQIAVLSIVRDSMPTLPRYYMQVKQLRDRCHAYGWRTRSVVVENDSVDGSYDSLDRNLPECSDDSVLVRAHDDCPHWPSVDDPARWRHIAWVCNQALAEILPTDDVVVYVEDDLEWDPREIFTMARHATEAGAITCPCYAQIRAGRYYDTWGSRLGGVRFSPMPPYHPDFAPGKWLNMDSCASVLALRADIARETRFDDDGFVGWSRQVKAANGGQLWLDPSCAVVHP
jgi:hypothetical protein